MWFPEGLEVTPFTKMKIKSFECPKSITNYEKIMLGTSDAWSVSHLSKRTSVLYLRLSDFRLMHILCQRKLTSFRVHLFRWCWLQQQGHLCRFEMWLSTWMGFICGLSWWVLHWNSRQNLVYFSNPRCTMILHSVLITLLTNFYNTLQWLLFSNMYISNELLFFC